MVADLNDNLVFSNKPARDFLQFSEDGECKIFNFFSDASIAQLKTLFRYTENESGSLLLQIKIENRGDHKVAWKSLKNRQGQIYARLFTFDVEKNRLST